MDAIPILPYRQRRAAALRVRERPSRGYARASLRRHDPGEQVLADLFAAVEPVSAGRILARYAWIGRLRGGPDASEIRAAEQVWSICMAGTAEGRALAAAASAQPGSVRRWRALKSAARQALQVGHVHGAYALALVALDVARRARRRWAAAETVDTLARMASSLGAASVARRWTRRAARLRRVVET